MLSPIVAQTHLLVCDDLMTIQLPLNLLPGTRRQEREFRETKAMTADLQKEVAKLFISEATVRLKREIAGYNEQNPDRQIALEQITTHYDLMLSGKKGYIRDPDMDSLPDGSTVQYPVELPKESFFKSVIAPQR